MQLDWIEMRTRPVRCVFSASLLGVTMLMPWPGAVASGAESAEPPARESGLHEQLVYALAAYCEAASSGDEKRIRATRSKASMKFVDDLFAEMGRDIAQAFAQMKEDCQEYPDYSGDKVEVLHQGATAGLFVARIPEDVPNNIECRLARFVDEGDGWKFDASEVVYSETLEVDEVRYADVEGEILEVHRINGVVGQQMPPSGN